MSGLLGTPQGGPAPVIQEEVWIAGGVKDWVGLTGSYLTGGAWTRVSGDTPAWAPLILLAPLLLMVPDSWLSPERLLHPLRQVITHLTRATPAFHFLLADGRMCVSVCVYICVSVSM